MSDVKSPTNAPKSNHVNKCNKELKFSDKCEVITTDTMYKGGNRDGYRDSGCYEDDSNGNNTTAGDGIQNNKVSAKSLDKKANALKKKSDLKSRRTHSKSCSSSGPYEGSELAELDRIVLSLQHSVNISDAKINSKSRTGRRGEVKKTRGKPLRWGKPGDELSADTRAVLDENDPNYDSELDDSIRLQMEYTPVSEADFDRLCNAWIDEYFDHADAREVCALLRELTPSRAQLVRFPYLAISMALERKPLQCELTSQLLSAVCDGNDLLNHQIMEQGFKVILSKELEDLSVDVPEAPESVGCFIARAIADDLIPPKFVENHKGRVINAVMLRALQKAENLLHMPHAYAHLDAVWLGPAGIRSTSHGGPTKQLSRAIGILLKEYLDAQDKREVDRTIRELDAPHFLHELVFQGLLLVIERSTELASNAIADLLNHLYTSGICTSDIINQGVQRIYSQLSDISLDVPSAYLIMDRFMKEAVSMGFVTVELVKKMPRKKQRSRFISECVSNHKSLKDDTQTNVL